MEFPDSIALPGRLLHNHQEHQGVAKKTTFKSIDFGTVSVDRLSKTDVSINQPQSSVMVAVMTGYNVFAIALLVYAGLGERISGQGLWPAVIVHSLLLIWGLTQLWKRAG
jgi:hypothetical protein